MIREQVSIHGLYIIQENPTSRHCDADMASSKYVLDISWMHEAHEL